MHTQTLQHDHALVLGLDRLSVKTQNLKELKPSSDGNFVITIVADVHWAMSPVTL